MCACLNLRKAARAVTQCYDEAFRPLGLRSTQMPILSLAEEMGPMTVTELARAMVTDHTTVIRNIRLLEKRGFVRTETGSDRRERHIFLTVRGKRLLHQAAPLWKKAQEDLIRCVGERRFKRLLSDLSVVIAATRAG